MSGVIRVPDERECLECGRREVWDEESENWVIEDDAVGDRYCIHDWDITGEFTPVER